MFFKRAGVWLGKQKGTQKRNRLKANKERPTLFFVSQSDRQYQEQEAVAFDRYDGDGRKRAVQGDLDGVEVAGTGMTFSSKTQRSGLLTRSLIIRDIRSIAEMIVLVSTSTSVE